MASIEVLPLTIKESVALKNARDMIDRGERVEHDRAQYIQVLMLREWLVNHSVGKGHKDKKNAKH